VRANHTPWVGLHCTSRSHTSPSTHHHPSPTRQTAGVKVKYIDTAAAAAKGEAEGAKYAAILGKKAAKEQAKGEADAAKFASKLAKGEAEGPDCDKKAPGEAVSFTVTETITKAPKEAKVRRGFLVGGSGDAGRVISHEYGWMEPAHTWGVGGRGPAAASAPPVRRPCAPFVTGHAAGVCAGPCRVCGCARRDGRMPA
jgi:hypothetical protein